MRAHVDGSPCELCGRGMWRDKTLNFDGISLHADHEIPRAVAGPMALASRLVHGSCNSRSGGLLGAALHGKGIREPDDERTRLAFAWP